MKVETMVLELITKVRIPNAEVCKFQHPAVGQKIILISCYINVDGVNEFREAAE
jgi:hypothetical protein